MEPTGIEPATPSLQSCGGRMEAAHSQAVTNGTANACTNACTSLPETEHGGRFAEALLMLTRLPLTDAERAEAVRRLLASQAEATAAKGAKR